MDTHIYKYNRCGYEIGGPLQRGGIIAREYGIPCVSSLVGIMDILKDGDIIEVDGTNGCI